MSQIALKTTNAMDLKRHRQRHVSLLSTLEGEISIGQINRLAFRNVYQYFAFSQLQCQLIQSVIRWTSSLSDFNAVECLSQ